MSHTAPPPRRPYRDEVGADPGALRIGVLAHDPRGQVDVHPECVAAVERTRRTLADLGHRVADGFPAALADPAVVEPILHIITAATARDLDSWGERTGRPLGPDDVEPTTWAMAEMGRAHTARDYLRAVATMHAWSRRVAAWWAEDGFDLLLTPTLVEPPPPLGTFAPTPDEPLRGLAHAIAFVTFTIPFNATGAPAISLPLHWNAAGLPIGVQLVAAYGREDLLLRVAAQLERAEPWANRRPPIHA